MRATHLSERALRDHGILHRINEDILWPLGLEMRVSVAAGQINILLLDGPGRSGLDEAAHAARHAAFEAFAASRTAAMASGPQRASSGPAAGTKKPPAPTAPGAKGKAGSTARGRRGTPAGSTSGTGQRRGASR